MVGCPGLLEDGLPVELRVGCGVVAAVEGFLIGLLLAVIRKRLSGNLSPAQPAAVGERRHKNRVHRALLLKYIQHRLDSFIDKRNGADLDADHSTRGFVGLRPGREESRPDNGGRGDAGNCAAKELPACQLV